jgi:hypothetical protein
MHLGAILPGRVADGQKMLILSEKSYIKNIHACLRLMWLIVPTRCCIFSLQPANKQDARDYYYYLRQESRIVLQDEKNQTTVLQKTVKSNTTHLHIGQSTIQLP